MIDKARRNHLRINQLRPVLNFHQLQSRDGVGSKNIGRWEPAVIEDHLIEQVQRFCF